MEALPLFTSFLPLSRSSALPILFFSNRSFFRYRKFGLRWNENWKLKPLGRIMMKDSSPNGVGSEERELSCVDFWGDSEFVEVLGIGSRNEAVLDFCLDSPFKMSSLRFWNLVMQDPSKVHLQQRFNGKDLPPRIIEFPLSSQYSSKAVILVVSAGYGFDDTAAVSILRRIRSTNGLTITIVLKPFSFEGQRRQDEVKELVGRLKEYTSLFIDIDPNMLLKKDMVTLDEALKTANSAVLLAINAISVIISDMHVKLVDVPYKNTKEVSDLDVIKILETYKEGKVGFGAGHNIRSSIAQSIYDCPFLGVTVKNLKGVALCILASSGALDSSDVDAFLHTFRDITEFPGEIILTTVHEPNLEPNLLMTTVLIFSLTEQQDSKRSGIFSKFAQHLPFVFNLLWRPQVPLDDAKENDILKNSSHSNLMASQENDEMGTKISLDGIAEDLDNYTKILETKLGSSEDYFYTTSELGQVERGLLETDPKISSSCDEVTEGSPLQRESLSKWKLGPGYQIAQQWAKERAADVESTSALDSICIFDLPVGVRPLEDLNGSVDTSPGVQFSKAKGEDSARTAFSTSSTPSLSSLTDASFEAVREFYNTASILVKGKSPDVSKKHGVLSVRAASMLEAERDSPKKWCPVVDMQYRGGTYRGRCQGGLPEGKGRLILGDGSIYDGMWHYGKRSGSGTFYFSNGDVFQGSWRDDVMHGKGWFYFHTGDRWFANFWKGKAYGEGRFYSKSGDVLFGHFEDGWRHGQFLCINVDGARYAEIWNQGLLVSREKLDSGISPA